MPLPHALRRLSALLILLPTLGTATAEQSIDGYDSAITRRMALEAETHDNPFVITPHKPTYLLPIAYDSNPNETIATALPTKTRK